MGLDDFCNTGLVLGLGFSSSSSTAETQKSTAINKKAKKQGFNFDNQLEKTAATVSINLEPSLTLSLLSESSYEYDHHQQQVGNNKKLQDHGITKVQSVDLYRQDTGASSFFNVIARREREFGSEDGETTTDHRVSNSKVSDEDDDGSNGRKKLRLSKAQSVLLEECFKEHNTLNPKQKQELAKELKLRPRQVEVWFQNRRARTKLKQTEVDCEFLKKCCETLTDENRRLQMELQELKAVKLAQPLCMQLPAATLTMCPSCERSGGTVGVGHDNRSKNALMTMTPKTHFYNHFPNPSAAC